MIRKNYLTWILLVLLVFATATILYLLIQIEDRRARIEAGVANECIIQHQRDFLLALPKFMRSVQNKESLLTLLKKKYPNTLVCSFGEDICWMNLRLKFTDDFTLKEIVEDKKCINER